MDTEDRFLKEIGTNPDDAFDIARLLFERANTPELRMQPALRNLALCYHKAQKDEQARIPSYLEAAIQIVVGLLPQPANLFGERRAEPRYQEQRDGGSDMSPRGGQLRPGS